MSEPMVTTHARPTPQLLSLLCAHLPHSLPLLRRLQFAAGNPAGTTEHSRILFSGSSPEDHDAVFAAAYVDVSRGPETEAWVYSSLEGRKTDGDGAEAEDRHVLALLRAVRALRDEYDASNPERERQKPTVLFGTLGDAVRLRLLNLGVVSTYVTVWDKWVFRLAGLPGGAVAAAERHMAAGDMGWGAVESGEDARLVISRTKIPRQERTLLSLPSTAIKLGDGTPVAWAFLSCDGSLASLHCEEPYRGRGFAKAVAVKLMQDHLGDFGDDGYCAADVAPDNAQSQGVCRSLGGKVAWTVTWNRIDLDRLPNLP
ncbi:Uroporphyrinogen decarboxylase in heme biosynthesis [Pestalotiopsis sp. IQ-011]